MKTILLKVEVENDYPSIDKVMVGSKENGYFGIVEVTEITLPSEEEIEREAFNKSGVFDNHFINGATWLLNKLKS